MLATIRTADFADWKKKKEDREIRPNTIKKYLILLSHIFNVARMDWKMESLRSPIENMRWPKTSIRKHVC
jgi:hypothetical protein